MSFFLFRFEKILRTLPIQDTTWAESVLLEAVKAGDRLRECDGDCSRCEWQGDCGSEMASCHSAPLFVEGRTSLSGCDMASWEKSLTTSLNVSSPWESDDFISSSSRPKRRRVTMSAFAS